MLRVVFIFALLIAACIYSLPNFFPEDPVVTISHVDGKVTSQNFNTLLRQLKTAGSPAISSQILPNGSIVLRFSSVSYQLNAADEAKSLLDYNHSVALNSVAALPHWLTWLKAEPMNLGLDLRGGVYFLLQVDFTDAVHRLSQGYAREIGKFLREKKVRYRKIRVSGTSIYILLREGGEATDEVQNKLLENWDGTFVVPEEENLNTNRIVLDLSPDEIKKIVDTAVLQNVHTLRQRVNEIGVAEPIVTRQGQDRIAVQLPGIQDTATAKEILGATATLEFHLVEERFDPKRLLRRKATLPPSTYVRNKSDGTPVLLKKPVILSGEHVIGASSGIDQNGGGAAVFITLDGAGGRKFSKITGENIKRLMAVVFLENKTEFYRSPKDGKLNRRTEKIEKIISVARIQEQLGNRFQITGINSSIQARKLALLLRAGALAAPVQIIEERTVGPSLGQQNIDRGTKSIVLGFFLIVLFMIFYYRLFGVFAIAALVFNLLLIVATMSLLPGATLTLPGIAGIVLTVGMAVDANVLIFERIREELSNKGEIYKSIAIGYRRAVATITDANITTLIAAIVLFAFGTGPIKGFAVTLSIGIICSMFTAIVVTRCMVDTVYNGRRKIPLLI